MLECTCQEIEFHSDISQATNSAQIERQQVAPTHGRKLGHACYWKLGCFFFVMNVFPYMNFSFLDTWCLSWMFFPCTPFRVRANNISFPILSTERWSSVMALWTSTAVNSGALIITLKVTTFLYCSYCKMLSMLCDSVPVSVYLTLFSESRQFWSPGTVALTAGF